MTPLRNRIDYGLEAARAHRPDPRGARWLAWLALATVLASIAAACAHAARPAAAPRPPLNYWLPLDDDALVCTQYLDRALCVSAREVRDLIGTRKVAP